MRQIMFCCNIFGIGGIGVIRYPGTRSLRSSQRNLHHQIPIKYCTLCELLAHHTTSPQKCSDLKILGNSIACLKFIFHNFTLNIMRYPTKMCQRKQMLNFSPCEIRFEKKSTLANLAQIWLVWVRLSINCSTPKPKNPWKTRL